MKCSCDQSTSVPYAASDKTSQQLTCLSFNYSFPRIEWRSSIHDIERLRLSSHHDSKEVSSQHRFCSCKHEFGVANHNSFAYNVYHQQKKRTRQVGKLMLVTQPPTQIEFLTVLVLRLQNPRDQNEINKIYLLVTRFTVDNTSTECRSESAQQIQLQFSTDIWVTTALLLFSTQQLHIYEVIK